MSTADRRSVVCLSHLMAARRVQSEESMIPMRLHQSTGISAIDQTLMNVLAIFEQHLPQRVLSYYLVESYAVGEALPASDIDLVVVVKDQLTSEDRHCFAMARDHCKQVSSYTLDLSLESEAKLLQVGGVWFQIASRLLFGVDIRPLIPRKPVQSHTRDLMHSVFPLLARVRAHPSRLVVPLDYPDASGSYYGYDHRRIRNGGHERSVGTKDLVTSTLAIANALTLRRAGQYGGRGRKADIPVQYAHWIADDWIDLVTDVYHLCRNRWGYALPTTPAEQMHLRHLCQQVLAFENHFLQHYCSYLLEELRQVPSVTVHVAVQRLGQLIYPDRAVVTALIDLHQHADVRLAAEIHTTLQWYRSIPLVP